MKIEDCICPIIDEGKVVGQAFYADNYLITSAHIIKDFPDCYFQEGSNKTYLSKFMPSIVYLGKGDFCNNPNELDVIIFYIDGINSLLHLSDYTPRRIDTLSSCCVEWIEDEKVRNPIVKHTTEKAYPLGEEEGNYFYCYCKRFQGSSGSPLLKGNEVVGIMQGGDDKGLCAFLKIDMLLENMRLDEICLAYCSDNSQALEDKEYSLWCPHSKIVKKNGKLGVVIDEDCRRKVIVPFQYDTWFSLDGREGIWQDFFDDYEQYYGYFAIRNNDGTYTCYEFDKEGHQISSFVCESFNKDVIRLHGKTYIGKVVDGEAYDDVKRMGYYYGQLGNDNCYFALRKGNKWSLIGSDIKKTYIDYVECDGYKEIGWAPKGYYAILIKGDKYQICIGKKDGYPLILPGEYDYIDMRYCMSNDGARIEGICFGIKKGNKWAICSNDLQYVSPFIFDRIGDMTNENEITGIRLINDHEIRLEYKIIHPAGWKVKNSRPFSVDEISAVKSAVVVHSDCGNNVCFIMHTGGKTYLPLSEYSILAVGDEIDVKSATFITLCRNGDKDSYRVIE